MKIPRSQLQSFAYQSANMFKHAKAVHHNYSYTKRQNNQQLYCWLPDSIYADYGN